MIADSINWVESAWIRGKIYGAIGIAAMLEG
jgi:hypothetical protein